MPTADHDHYERAFAEWLRAERIPYVSVEQVRRPADDAGPMKNFDFLVHSPAGPHYIVDVKGRRFPNVTRRGETYWENWVHLSDLEGLLAWEKHFGEGYTSLLVYCYWLQLPPGEPVARKTVTSRGRDYLLVAVPARTYAENCRRRSLRWQAVSVPAKTFCGLAKPVEKFLRPRG